MYKLAYTAHAWSRGTRSAPNSSEYPRVAGSSAASSYGCLQMTRMRVQARLVKDHSELEGECHLVISSRAVQVACVFMESLISSNVSSVKSFGVAWPTGERVAGGVAMRRVFRGEKRPFTVAQVFTSYEALDEERTVHDPVRNFQRATYFAQTKQQTLGFRRHCCDEHRPLCADPLTAARTKFLPVATFFALWVLEWRREGTRW
ncbi:hypothetical protein DFH09DRAFT_1089236 [Mycena vulgaris]|nr:hypothetical protein DFH09DRAFT_1089236 [Mycena vulgaris]